MGGPLYLGWKYVVHHRWKAGLLVAAMTLIGFLPPALLLLVERGAENLTQRAAATPLLLGSMDSPLELTLSSLYFSGTTPAPMTFAAMDSVDPSLARAIPLYVRYRSRAHAIVGTTPTYLEFRSLQLAAGRPFALLGECVVGAGVAAALDVGVGDSLISAPETLFDLAGVYPLKMLVVGVLEPMATADDDAIFTDLKTTWVIEGLGHGHQELADQSAPELVLSRDERSVTANAAVVQFNEITDANRHRFHFHGDLGGYPVSAGIVVPKDERAAAILLGRFLEVDEWRLLRPRLVIEELLETVFAVQALVLAILSLVAIATLATAVLVFGLSLRLRAREFLTLQRMGASHGSILLLMGAETLIVLVLSALLAGGLLGLAQRLNTTEILLWFSS